MSKTKRILNYLVILILIYLSYNNINSDSTSITVLSIGCFVIVIVYLLLKWFDSDSVKEFFWN